MIKRHLKNLKLALKEVYSKPQYLILTLIIALLIFLFNTLVINYKLLFTSLFSISFVVSLIQGTLNSMFIHTIILLIILSILTGILFSFLIFKIKSIESIKKKDSLGFFGATLGILVPACSACGLGLLALLGYAGIIAILPFRGLELGIFALAILLFAIFSLSNKITEATCKPQLAIKKKKKN